MSRDTISLRSDGRTAGRDAEGPFRAARGITVCNVPGYGDHTVAEHAFALLLAVSRHLVEAVERTRRGDFPTAGLRGFDLRGRTLGVVGIGRIGRRAIDTEEDTSTAYGLASDEPVISPDLAREKRSKVARFLAEHGVKALVNVLIHGADGKPPFGILEADSRRPGRFTATDTDFLRTYANLLADAIERVSILRTLRSDPQPDTRSD